MKIIVISGIVILVILTFFMICICIKYEDRPLSDEEAKEQQDYLDEWRRRKNDKS